MSSSIEADQGVLQSRWAARAVPQLLAGAREQVAETQQAVDAFGFVTTEPLRFSSTGGWDDGSGDQSVPPLLDSQMASDGVANLDPSLQPNLGSSYRPLPNQYLMPEEFVANNLIRTLLERLGDRGIEFSDERTLVLFDNMEWNGKQIEDQIYATEQGTWTPPP